MADTNRPANLRVKIYYEDTDAGGVVYHANYLRYMERGRGEWLSHLGFEHRKLAEEQGVAFVVSRIEISYKAAARLDDVLEVRTTPVRFGPVRIVFLQEVLFSTSGTVAVSAEVEVACVDPASGRLAKMPVNLAELIRSLYPNLSNAPQAPGGRNIEGLEVLKIAGTADADELAELNSLLLEEEKYDRSFTHVELVDRMSTFLGAKSDYDAFFIVDSGRTAGYLLANRGVSPVYVRQFYVHPEFRRRGLGRRAIDELERYYHTSDLDVEVMAWNDLGMKFWESIGFRHRYNGLRRGSS
ncbi:MAG TPA: tol-pal system-associated acyl-CoA thioesterase [Spirochaetia bacterium]|nr:tol-pal system-associated acyl-CoA thioesterase [Spirochaetia bacterium]